MRVYYDRDADVNLIKSKKVVIVGYGRPGLRPCAQPGRTLARPMRALPFVKAPRRSRRHRPMALKSVNVADAAKADLTDDGDP